MKRNQHPANHEPANLLMIFRTFEDRRYKAQKKAKKTVANRKRV
jgi:hypothetical protein